MPRSPSGRVVRGMSGRFAPCVAHGRLLRLLHQKQPAHGRRRRIWRTVLGLRSRAAAVSAVLGERTLYKPAARTAAPLETWQAGGECARVSMADAGKSTAVAGAIRCRLHFADAGFAAKAFVARLQPKRRIGGLGGAALRAAGFASGGRAARTPCRAVVAQPRAALRQYPADFCAG